MVKIDGVDIEKFGAKILKVDVQLPDLQVNREWIDGAKLPITFEGQVKESSVEIEILLKGENRNQILLNVGRMAKLIKKACVLELDGYENKFMSYLSATTLKKTIAKTHYILTLQCNGYFFSDNKKIEINGLKGTVYNPGNRETPCILYIILQEDKERYEIQGMTKYPIVLLNVHKGKEIIIDGIKGIVTEDGENKFGETEIWEFPFLAMGENHITSSNEGKMTVEFNPMWM